MAKKESKKTVGDVVKKAASSAKKAAGSKITAEDVENWKQKKRASKKAASGKNTASANNTLYAETRPSRISDYEGAVGKAKYTGSRMAYIADMINGNDHPRRGGRGSRSKTYKL